MASPPPPSPEPLPQLPGPKFAPFTPSAAAEIEFIEQLGRPAIDMDSFVWKVRINGMPTCYALKMVSSLCFFAIVVSTSFRRPAHVPPPPKNTTLNSSAVPLQLPRLALQHRRQLPLPRAPLPAALPRLLRPLLLRVPRLRPAPPGTARRRPRRPRRRPRSPRAAAQRTPATGTTPATARAACRPGGPSPTRGGALTSRSSGIGPCMPS